MDAFLLLTAVCITAIVFLIIYRRSATPQVEGHATRPETNLEQVSEGLKYIKLRASRPPPTLPSKVVFVDVETTGLTARDRIVSFAAILLDTQQISTGTGTTSVMHVIFDPGKKSHPRAESKHGYSDWILRHQDPFTDHAESIEGLLSQADIIVAHNADFDVDFIHRELIAVGRQPPKKPIYCTMQTHRNLEGGSSSLEAVARRLGLSRKGTTHGALEDAWLAMMIYLDQHDCPFKFRLDGLPSDIFNLKTCPPMPDGPLPRRKRKRTAKVQSPGDQVLLQA